MYVLHGHVLRSATSDYHQRHVIVFRPISVAARSWSYNKLLCYITTHEKATADLLHSSCTLLVLPGTYILETGSLQYVLVLVTDSQHKGCNSNCSVLYWPCAGSGALCSLDSFIDFGAIYIVCLASPLTSFFLQSFFLLVYFLT